MQRGREKQEAGWMGLLIDRHRARGSGAALPKGELEARPVPTRVRGSLSIDVCPAAPSLPALPTEQGRDCLRWKHFYYPGGLP